MRLPKCIALALAILPLACSRSPRAHPAARVLVVGVDGLEWNVLRPLLAQGRCPNLRALMERGSFGKLETMQPTLSPIVWTTIATGRLPEDHGILGFTDAEVRGKAYTSSQRRVRAIWNIADRYGLSSDVFGWWITWPAEEIRGLMVSGSSSAALVDDNWKPALLPGIPRQVEPRSLEPEVLAIAKKAGSIEEVHRLAREMVFGSIPDAALGDVERKLMRQTLWSIQSDETFFEECRRLMPSHRADLNFVYLGGPDVVGHRFWRYYEPEKFRWPGNATADARWKEISPDSAPLVEILATKDGEKALALVIPSDYQWIDRMIGDLVKAAGPETTVIVCSDHGFHAFGTEEPNTKFIGLSRGRDRRRGTLHPPERRRRGVPCERRAAVARQRPRRHADLARAPRHPALARDARSGHEDAPRRRGSRQRGPAADRDSRRRLPPSLGDAAAAGDGAQLSRALQEPRLHRLGGRSSEAREAEVAWWRRSPAHESRAFFNSRRTAFEIFSWERMLPMDHSAS